MVKLAYIEIYIVIDSKVIYFIKSRQDKGKRIKNREKYGWKSCKNFILFFHGFCSSVSVGCCKVGYYEVKSSNLSIIMLNIFKEYRTSYSKYS